MKVMLKNLQLASTLLMLPLLTSVLAGCTDEQSMASQGPPPPPKVTVSSPLMVPVTHYAEFSGTTRAAESVEIRARIGGIIEKVFFTEGAMVQKGEPLLLIDPRPYQALVNEAQAQLAMRKADLRLAEATKLRRENAFKDKAVSEVAVIEARANLTSAKAAVSAAEATLNRAKLDLSYTTITAPISGRIGDTAVDQGNLLKSDSMVLTTIVKTNPIHAYFSISEKELLLYKEHLYPVGAEQKNPEKVKLQLSDGSYHQSNGRIDYMDNKLDADTGTLLVRAVFPNEQNTLLPGLFSRVRIPLGEEVEELMVPDTALGRNQQGAFLLITGEDNIVRQQPVVIGNVMDGMRIIAEGIFPDDRVIVNGLQKARPGAPVTPVEKNAQVSAAEQNKKQPSA